MRQALTKQAAVTGTDHHSPLDALLGATPRKVARHWLSLLVLTLAAIGAAVFFVRFVTGDNSPYYSAPVERGDLVPLISERGIVRGSGEVTVRAEIDGRVIWVASQTDGQVRQGDVLARIDTSELQDRIATDTAQLTSAQDMLKSAQVSEQDAATKLARFENVWKQSNGRVPSLNEMEAARADARRAGLATDAAQSAVTASQVQLNADKAKADSAEVRTQIDGIIARRWIVPGQSVEEHQPLFTIAAGLAPLTVEVPLSAGPIGPIRAGTKARIRLDAMPDKVQSATLSLLKVSPPPQSAPPHAVFTLENPDAQVRPGMPATVEIDLPERRNVLLVPDAALAFDPGQANTSGRKRKRIYLLSRDGEPRRVYVTVGGSDGTRTEIFATGIHPGDQVITGWRDPAAGP